MTREAEHAGDAPDAAADFDLSRLAEIPDPVGDLGGSPASAPAPPSPSKMGDALTRADVRRRRWLAVAASAGWLVAVSIALGIRGDFGSGEGARATLRTVVQVLLPAAAGAAVLVVAMSAGARGLGTRTRILTSAFAIAATVFPLAALIGSGVFLDDRPGMVRGIVTCFVLVLVLGGVPLVAMGVALRHAFAANAPWRSILVAGGAGLAAAAALGSHCSTHCGTHVAMGHAMPAVFLAFAGGALLHRVTRV
jgi:hypothetical protein